MKRLLTRSGGLSALLALALATFAVGTMFADDGDESAGDCRNDCTDGASGSSDDTKTSGEVLSFNTLVQPNEMAIGNTDGRVIVKFYGAEAPYIIKSSGVKVGDYIEVSGWKENEGLFWADVISARDENED